MQTARERLGHRRDVGREGGRDGEEVPARDPLGDEEKLGVGAVQQRKEVLAECLLASGARGAGAARRGVRGDEAPPRGDVDAADLVAERARWRAEQHGVAAAIGLQVGPVREGDLDLEYDVSLVRCGVVDLLQPEVAGAVQPEGSHGVKTTFSASRRRNSSSPSAKRSSGRTAGSGTSRSWSSARASGMYGGAAERVPTTFSSRR